MFLLHPLMFFKDIYRKEDTQVVKLFSISRISRMFSLLNVAHFFKTILQSIEVKGWVDIENDYYQLLKAGMDNPDCDYTIGELNEQLVFLQRKIN